MTDKGDPARVEEQLFEQAQEAIRRGFTIVYGTFEQKEHNEVCVLGAHNIVGGELALPRDSDEAALAWDSIENGFDGLSCSRAPLCDPRRVWTDVGLRLRARLAPREATS